MKNRLVRKGLVLGIIILFGGAGVIPSTVGTMEKKTAFMVSSSPGYIQDLIDNASNGDKVYIPSGTYYENIIINKSISLIGEDKDTTIIDGNHSVDVIYVSADCVNISGFTIRKSGGSFFYHDAGIDIHSNCNIINGNIISNNFYGIFLDNSSSNTITGNTISYNYPALELLDSCSNTITGNNISDNEMWGIKLDDSCSNTITGNIISNNGYGTIVSYYGLFLGSSNSNTITRNTINSNNGIGIFLDNSSSSTITGNIISLNNYDGIYLFVSNSSTITGNKIFGNNYGINIYVSNSNTITGNSISDNKWGIKLDESSSNIILKNNFLKNQRHAIFKNCKNTWKQNYWNRPRLLPKLIFGRIGRLSLIPWFNIDWRPALKPYDI